MNERLFYLKYANELSHPKDFSKCVKIFFQENINNLEQITCFSNEGNKWRNSKISFIEKNTLEIKISEKFI